MVGEGGRTQHLYSPTSCVVYDVSARTTANMPTMDGMMIMMNVGGTATAPVHMQHRSTGNLSCPIQHGPSSEMSIVRETETKLQRANGRQAMRRLPVRDTK